jgi:hypothetical protein
MKIIPASSEDLIASRRNRERIEREDAARENNQSLPVDPLLKKILEHDTTILKQPLKKCLNPLCDKKISQKTDKDCCSAYCCQHVRHQLNRLPELLEKEKELKILRDKKRTANKKWHAKNPNYGKEWNAKNPNYAKEWYTKQKLKKEQQ